MNSFLMNPTATYVDPKFPPSEEYNQSSYIPHSEYYLHQSQAYGYQHAGDHQLGYGRDMAYNHEAAAAAASATTSYYQQPFMGSMSSLHLQHSSPHQSVSLHSHSSALPASTSPVALSVSALGRAQNQQQSGNSGNGVADVSASMLNSRSAHQPNPQQQQQGSALNQQLHILPHQHHQQQQQHLLTTSSAADLSTDHSLVDKCDSDETEEDSTDSTGRVIYPWMKKIHVAGAGEWIKSE